MKKLYLTALMAVFFALTANATAPWRRVRVVRQPDGTSLRVTAMANGRYITYATEDGLALVRESDGRFCYARTSGGTLASTGVTAHSAALRSAAEKAEIAACSLPQTEAAELLEALHPMGTVTRVSRSAASTSDGLGKYKQSGGGLLGSIGSPVVPVVMVNFADRTFQDTITMSKVSRFFNEEGYHDEAGTPGSVRDYFVDQSQGLFTPTFEVVDSVTLSKNYAYYGANSTSGSIDQKDTEFMSEALNLAAQKVDFSQYATSGQVPAVILMFAGPGEQNSFETGSANYLWAKHKSRTVSVNGGKASVRSVLMANELLQSYGSDPEDVRDSHMEGIGLYCHEFGHVLGLPDFYYTGSNTTIYDTLRTMGYWSIMDYGEYYNNGYAPPGYTAYERSTLGWLDVQELTEAQFVQLYPYGRESEGATACLIRNEENNREYYLLENRQHGKWYPAGMGKGMLVIHVDYDASAWSSNRVNNDPQHQRYAFVPADNRKEGYQPDGLTVAEFWKGYRADLFPGVQDVTSFTDDTTPAMTFYNGTAKKAGKPLYNISLSDDGVISFSFIDSSLTGIQSASVDGQDGEAQAAYTLDGRRVGSLKNAAPGIYILPNGKKIIKR